MGQLTVRQVEEEVVRALKLQAARSGRSAEAEHREILRQALLAKKPRVSLEEYLRTMPDAGEDADFARIEGSMRELEP
ncbi:MAG: DNA-binding protein [Deltaproteobacteria bacterium]|nr:DNA-binding protein [Deltaproteobacteria bacterium]